MLCDTHTHLFSEQFENDIDVVVEQAKKSGVSKFYLPNIDSSSIDSMLQLSKKYPDCMFPMMGLHPCSVKENYKEELAIIESYLEKEKFCAVGEIGIDLYWEKTYINEQKAAFRFQIELAKKHKLPIVIHVRESFDDVFEILDEMNDNTLSGVFHCFTGTTEQAEKIIGYGNFKIGIGGVVTFKNSGLDAVVKEIDLKHIVLETDSPYLAPAPHRGKRNQSSYLIEIAEKMATIKETSLEKIAEITSKNAFELYGC